MARRKRNKFGQPIGKSKGKKREQRQEEVKQKKKKRNKKNPSIVGVLQKHQRGFGFVVVEGVDDDIFIGADGMNTAMNGDTVEVDLIPEILWKNSREGIITGIVQRKYKEVVGTFQLNGKFGFVVPDDKKNNDDIFIVGRLVGAAEDGDKVVAEILKYPEKNKKAEGKITQVISKFGEPGGDIKALIRQHNLVETFDEKVAKEAKAKAKEPITKAEIGRRRDLREKFTVTIDGADSKDFDDAVSVERLDNGNYLLGVHIADVAHYVIEDGPLDQEALKRGNSVYLIDQVIPMLPKELSNGMCSLNPNEDRLTLTCDMEIDGNGVVVKHSIYESIIHSHKRLVYGDVSDIIENNIQGEEYEYIHEMARLAEILSENRSKRGSLDFDLDEAYITLDEKGVPVNIAVAERRSANKLIEEFMLLANETVAKHFFQKEAPFVYRVHETPTLERMEEFRTFLQGFGINLNGDLAKVNPKTLNEILCKVQGETFENVINTVMLRSMQKAKYDVECEGHFGLALSYYCHFTSPIRRYPDLMIHRIIKSYLNGKINQKSLKKFSKDAKNVAEIASLTERQAIELEREVEKMKMTEYMSYHVGEEYEGVISGVTNFGIYVELPNTVEGMIKLSQMSDDYYDYDASKYRIIGRQSKNVLALGDRVKIKVRSVSLSAHEIDFELVK
ncbi:MAG: ribonuclease R [Anaerovoracaceae bacterium]